MAPETPPAPPASSSALVTTVAGEVDPAVVDINVAYPGNDGGASGTGMILSSTGVVLTNNHVVKGAASISINVAGQSTTYPGKVLGVDPSADVALVQMEGAANLPTVTISSTPATVGQAVIAIGNALGKGGTPTVTAGSVTQLGETITATDFSGGSETLVDMMQTSAALAPGDSGGPLVNANGAVEGMDTAAGGPSGGSGFSSTAFAIPIGRAIAIAQQIEQGQGSTEVLLQPTAVMGVLGVAPSQWDAQYGTIDPSLAEGAAVEIVESGSPAEAAGIVPGDIITTFAGQTVTSPTELEQLETGYQPGATVSVGWVTSSGQTETATLNLIAGPWA